MSTGLECDFVTIESGEVFYLLQNWNCPAGAWDWRQYATCYGPFTSMKVAEQHLSDNHANPGGYSSYEHKSGGDAVLDGLIAEARAARKVQPRPMQRLRW